MCVRYGRVCVCVQGGCVCVTQVEVCVLPRWRCVCYPGGGGCVTQEEGRVCYTGGGVRELLRERCEGGRGGGASATGGCVGEGYGGAAMSDHLAGVRHALGEATMWEHAH